MKRWLKVRHGMSQAACAVAPLHKPGFPVLVCWSAKAGCTTVLKWFLRHTGLWEAALAFDPWPHRYRARVLTQQHDRYVADCMAALRRGDVEVVKVVRDPALRAVSSYLHFLRMAVDPEWLHGVDAWKQRVGLGRQPGLSFEQFLSFVIEQRETDGPLDIHFHPQWIPGWDHHVDRCIPLEGLAAALADVESAHGLPRIDIRDCSDSRHHNAPDAGHRWPSDAARFAARGTDLRTLGTPPPEALLDERTVELVRAAYACDYEAYGHLYRVPRSTGLKRRAAA